MTEHNIEVREGQLGREEEIIRLVSEHCPQLYLHSRTGGGRLTTCLARLRFDRRSALVRLKRLFLNAADGDERRSVLEVTGNDYSSLNLKDGWPAIELHLYDHRLFEAANRIGAEYLARNGRSVVIVLEDPKRRPRWSFTKRFLVFAALIALVYVGFRLGSVELVRYIFRNFPNM